MTHPPDIHSTGRIDVPFSVGFQHRLRYTDDVLGADRDALIELIHPSESKVAKVQIWVDDRVAAANPRVLERLPAIVSSRPGQMEMVGQVQVIQGGESVKNDRRHLERILAAINDGDLDRRSYLVVVGGGAVLDAVGFAAAVAHRGIRLIRIPTTTLAQADSGVGVKNAVNYFGKKNWLGAFAVPWGVINDAELLTSLPDRDFIGGFSEAVKVALLKSETVFDQICNWSESIRRRESGPSQSIIRASVEMHLDHITAGGDPFESLEARPLDFGHWSAHKLEPMSGFSIRHGEAVAIGVAIDSVYSSLALGFPRRDAARVLRCLTRLGFTLAHPMLDDVDTLFDGLEEFRQHLGGRLTLTMLRGVGRPLEVHEVDRDLMRAAIARVGRHRIGARRVGVTSAIGTA